MKRITVLLTLTGFFISAFISRPVAKDNNVESYRVITLAGNGQNRSMDGKGDKAGFSESMNHLAADAIGNLYVADGANLRKILPDGTVSTLFGRSVMNEDGSNKEIPRYLFSNGYGIAVDNENNLVLSMTDYTIVAIKNETEATILAGLRDEYGFKDGPVEQAMFSDPRGVCIDKNGNIYIADKYNGRIRKIDAGRKTVTTLAGSGRGDFTPGPGKSVKFPLDVYACAVDSKGNVYVGVNGGRGTCVAKITPAGMVTSFAGNVDDIGEDKDGAGAIARISAINAMCTDTKDNIYLACSKSVRKVTPAGVVTTIAGSSWEKGKADGAGKSARFSALNGICADKSGNIYVTDYENFNIRKIYAE